MLNHEAIKARREKLMLGVTEAAKRAGITREAWSRLESGGRPDPQLSTVERVAAALRIDVRKIITGSSRKADQAE